MSIQFDIAKQIIAETCPNRKLKLENIRLFADIIQPKKYRKHPIKYTLYFHKIENSISTLVKS